MMVCGSPSRRIVWPIAVGAALKVQVHDAIRVGERKRPEHHSVDDAEHPSRCADAKGERENGAIANDGALRNWRMANTRSCRTA